MNVPAARRIASLDILRGFVMLVMLLDHVRETFFLHHQVGDPVDVATVAPGLFFSRLLAHLCAPAFVFLAGVSAWLYGQHHARSRQAASRFLLSRGLLLVALELTLVGFAWTGQFPPQVIYLQVIWAIGISMVALAALLWLPHPLQLLLALAIIAGHNLLDAVQAADAGIGRGLWLVLHERGWLQFDGLRLRTSYPVLPWIGVILLGYAAGALFGAADERRRQRWLLGAALTALAGFVLLRLAGGYGDAAWQREGSPLQVLMSFFNLTKYPPSLQFLLFTLGLAWFALWLLERPAIARRLQPLALFGAAPMFFYLLHLYVLKLLYLAAVALWGLNQGAWFGVENLATLWLITLVLAVLLWWPTRAFARLKAEKRWPWLKYL